MAFKDDLGAKDHVSVGLSSEVTPPEHACPICGKAMKDARTDEDIENGRSIRICSSRECRVKADWTSNTPVLLNN